jgi:two-component system, OmpR family, phosphate regulon sensor histidine kinase PhoR
MRLPLDFARSVIDALDEPALIVDGSRTVAANAAAFALFGRHIEGADIRIALRHPEALSAVLSGMARDLELVGIGSVDRPWLLNVRPVGNVKLVRLIDRSETRATERMRVDFVANASHELRTPLATIVGYSETLSEEGEVDEGTRRQFGSVIHGEAKRMLQIVQDLMSLSRIEAERFLVPRETVDLGEVARLSADHAKPLTERASSSIELAIEDGLEPVAGDFGQLLQTADNLIANAIRYGCTRAGSTVTVEVRRDGERALLAVRDHGEGIAAEHLPRLTERFYRVNAARSRDSGGTGLGLAIVKHIVERHRGTLEIKSAIGKGTSVEIRIPFEPVAPSLS